ncbi:hypothetical protein ACIBL6_16285 [Streptomyces sp. NPDC050400]|uniref:hypothetical protein n=1 Tax=Streptomyces sp. NPDC050400 TaxID=3365610 RepID=UPI003787958F
MDRRNLLRDARAALHRIRVPQALRLPLGSPLQLALLVCSFALAAYAGVRLLDGDWLGVTVWIVGAALLHDLVLVPLYSAADRALLAAAGAMGQRARVGYVRVPAALSLLLLLVWFPLISGMTDTRYRSATGVPPDAFLPHWLLITAALFGGSALLLAGSVLRERRTTKRQRPSP